MSLFQNHPIYFLSVIPAPYQVRGKLQPESSEFKMFWTPVFTGVTVIGSP